MFLSRLFAVSSVVISLPALAGTDITQDVADRITDYKVVDTSLNCRKTPGGEIIAELGPHTSFDGIYHGYEKLSYVNGKPWMLLRVDFSRIDIPACWVRANTDFIQPLSDADGFDYDETSFNSGVDIPSLSLMIIDKDGLNCRKNLGSEFSTIVAKIPHGEYLGFHRMVNSTDPGKVLRLVLRLVPRDAADTKPWFEVELAGSNKRCFVRANSRHLRESYRLP